MDNLRLSCHEENDAASVCDVSQEIEGLPEQVGRLVQVEDAGVEPGEATIVWDIAITRTVHPGSLQEGKNQSALL